MGDHSISHSLIKSSGALKTKEVPRVLGKTLTDHHPPQQRKQNVFQKEVAWPAHEAGKLRASRQFGQARYLLE